MRSAMRCAARLSRLPSPFVIAAAGLLASELQAADVCSGHKLLRTPRSESSCTRLKLRIYPSPDGTLRAVIYPADISLDATPRPGEPRRDPHRQRKYVDVEGLFLAARFQRLLCRHRKVVAGLEIFCLQHVLLGRSQPLAISHRRVWPRSGARQREGPHRRL